MYSKLKLCLFRRLIGMIMCTSFQRQQENVNLTLAANFAYLLRDFMRQLGLNVTSVRVQRDSSNFRCKGVYECVFQSWLY